MFPGKIIDHTYAFNVIYFDGMQVRAYDLSYFNSLSCRTVVNERKQIIILSLEIRERKVWGACS